MHHQNKATNEQDFEPDKQVEEVRGEEGPRHAKGKTIGEPVIPKGFGLSVQAGMGGQPHGKLDERRQHHHHRAQRVRDEGNAVVSIPSPHFGHHRALGVHLHRQICRHGQPTDAAQQAHPLHYASPPGKGETEARQQQGSGQHQGR